MSMNNFTWYSCQGDVMESEENRRYNTIELAIMNNDLQALDRLIYPGSQFLNTTSPVFQKTPLHLVCESEKINIVTLQKLIDHGVDIDAQTINGTTPLHTVVGKVHQSLPLDPDRLQAVKILLKSGANPDIKRNNGLKAIQSAMLSNKLELVEAFLKEADQLFSFVKFDISVRLMHLVRRLLKNYHDWTVSETNYSLLLHFLIFQTDQEEIFEYATKESRFNVNALNNDGQTLLHVAAIHGNLRTMKALIDVGADPDVYSEKAKTPIISAICNKRPENVQPLLDFGASPNSIQKPQNIRESPFHYAIHLQNFEIAITLLLYGANINELINDCSPLRIACSDNKVKVAKFILDHGAEVNEKNEFGLTILDESCESGKFEIVKLLLENGAKLDQGDISTLHCAAKGANADMFRFFLEQGVNVNVRCKLDQTDYFVSDAPRTPFEFAIIYVKDTSKCCDMIRLMAEYGVNINLADPETGETLLHLACFSNISDQFRRTKSSNAEIIKCLLRCKANVNALDNRGLTALDHALRTYNLSSARRSDEYCNEVLQSGLKAIVACIAKMIVANDCVIENNLKLLENKHIISIYEECVKELNRMHQSICDSSNFSYVGILTKTTDALGRALQNKDLMQVLEEGKYKQQFPIYAYELEESILKGKLRHLMTELGSKIFHKHVKDNFHDEFIQICRYLNSEDLNNFMKAYSVQLCEKRLFFSNVKKVYPATMSLLMSRFDRHNNRI